MAETKEPTLSFESLSVHAGAESYSETGAVHVPIYSSTSFTFNDSAHGADIFGGRSESYAYSRLGNPTSTVFEQRMAALEGGVAALPTSSGEAARWMAIAGVAVAGQNIVAPSTLSEDAYTYFKYRLSPYNISVKFVDIDDPDAIRAAIDENTRTVYIESISSVGLAVADIESISSIAHAAGIPLIVDNTPGAGGYIIRPIDHGADIVVHSASEWLGGSGQAVAGVIIDSGKFPWNVHGKKFPHLTEPSPGYHGMNMWESFGEKAYILYVRMAILRDVGPCLNPFAAFSVISGIETLSPRIDRHNDNALALAAWLDTNEKVERVVYPGLTTNPRFDRTEKYLRHGYGGVLHFEPKGGAEAAKLIVAKLRLALISDGIGTAQTLVHLPEGFEARPQLKGIQTGSIRISVGLESIDDIIEDFRRAIESA